LMKKKEFDTSCDSIRDRDHGTIFIPRFRCYYYPCCTADARECHGSYEYCCGAVNDRRVHIPKESLFLQMKNFSDNYVKYHRGKKTD
jgi:hypothetical protein